MDFAELNRDCLYDLKLKMQFLATENIRQIKLPELARETKGRPALIEISQPLETERAPEIRETNIGAQRSQFDGRVEGKRSALRGKAVERVAVEMVAVGWVCWPIGIGVVRRDYPDYPAWLRYAMKLAHERHDVGNMLDHMAANDLVKFVVRERIGQDAQVVNDVSLGARV